jgi:PiT family inorganic phosphate transporter
MFGLSTGLIILLIVCLLFVCFFECINGFHDTANAVATVIYTNTLKPRIAVIWSGCWNFLGVYTGGIAVAMGIVNLLPTEALVDQNLYHGISMILALLITAVIWNLGTWYFGIPCSSSHALIGSIFGVCVAYMLLPGAHNISMNWGKVQDTALALFTSPFIGFGLALGLMFLLKVIMKKSKIFKAPSSTKAPPFWIRAILVLTCTSVSFSHGSNDGQKGVGLVMIILIGILPAYFALDASKRPVKLYSNTVNVGILIHKMDTSKLSDNDMAEYKTIRKKTDTLLKYTSGIKSFESVPATKRFELRKDIIVTGKSLDKLLASPSAKGAIKLSKDDMSKLKAFVKENKTYTEYAPWWVILMISLSLGIGTMIGWKRIVITIGEKIGKSHLTYAQGASAEIIAAATISASTAIGLPVSTTHVLSSGVAGTMVAESGFRNLQMKTVRNIAVAWLITLPVTFVVSGSLFLLLRWLIA